MSTRKSKQTSIVIFFLTALLLLFIGIPSSTPPTQKNDQVVFQLPEEKELPNSRSIHFAAEGNSKLHQVLTVPPLEELKVRNYRAYVSQKYLQVSKGESPPDTMASNAWVQGHFGRKLHERLQRKEKSSHSLQ